MAKFRNKYYGGKDFTGNYTRQDWTCGCCMKQHPEKEKKIHVCRKCIRKNDRNGKSKGLLQNRKNGK
jgi:hypothetical protein